jgi:hypothetical protein
MNREFVGLRMLPDLIVAIDIVAAEQGRNRSNTIEFMIASWIKGNRPELLEKNINSKEKTKSKK